MNATHLNISLGLTLGLWLADAATAQRTIGNSNPNEYAAELFSPYVLFAANDQTIGMELRKLDLLTMQVSLLADIQPNTPLSTGSHPHGFTYVPASLGFLFAADNGTTGNELWWTDGAATRPFLDLNPGAASANPDHLLQVGATCFFAAEGAATGRELWITDGTASSTVPLDIRSGPVGSDPEDLVEFQGMLFFTADDGVHGRELWRSDGSVAGTFMVKDLILGAASGNPAELTAVGNILYFAANSSTLGRELFVSDGTTAGTTLLKDIRPLANGSAPSQLVNTGVLYFVADDGVTGRELWRSNGTAAGTTLVADIHPNAGSDIADLIAGPGLLEVTCVADDGTHGRELWRADFAGATMLPETVTGGGSADPTALQRVFAFDRVVFRATDPTAGTELWAYDGFSTARIRDIRPGSLSSHPSGMKTMASIQGITALGVLFAANDGPTGIELWRTDGSAAFTVQVADIAPNLLGPPPPRTHGETNSTSAALTVEGIPNSLGGFAIDVSTGAGVVLPGLLQGTFLLTPAAQILLSILDNSGRASVTFGIPVNIAPLDLFVQGFDFSASSSQFRASDLTTIGIRKFTGSIGGGTVDSVTVYDDDNHLYDIDVHLPSTMPASGKFMLFNVKQRRFAPLETGGDWSPSQGLQLHFKGQAPHGWSGKLQIFFFAHDGQRFQVAETYC